MAIDPLRRRPVIPADLQKLRAAKEAADRRRRQQRGAGEAEKEDDDGEHRAETPADEVEVSREQPEAEDGEASSKPHKGVDVRA